MDSTNITTIPTQFGDSRVAPLGPKDRRLGYSPVEYRMTYINHSGVDISICWRSGLKFTLPSIPSFDGTELLVRVEIIVGPAVMKDFERFLATVNNDSTKELKCFREAFEMQKKANTYGGAQLVVDYPINLDDIRNQGGTVYSNELDCILSLLPVDALPPHPFSEESRAHATVIGSPMDHGNVGFGYGVELIDNSGLYGVRYLNINGGVYKVTPKRDILRRDGVYIVTSDSSNQLKDGPTYKYHPFDVGEETLGLYRSHEEALALGDISNKRKHEIATLEHDLAHGRLIAAQEKSKHDLAMQEKDRELKLLEERQALSLKAMEERTLVLEHERKLERERIKDVYESRSYVRKDSSESLKFLPSILIGIGAIFMAFKTFVGK